jgi:hypothetical protein
MLTNIGTFQGCESSVGKLTVKKLIVFSIFVLMTVSCAPSQPAQEEIQETVQAIIAETQVASPTVIPSLVPQTMPAAPTLTQPTEIPSEPATNTVSAASTTFTGSIEIEEGRCCIGGFDGETVQARVSFSATSPFGRVTRMRVTGACPSETDLEQVDWEPFVESKTYPVHVILNWSGFYRCVQYQDEFGNLSPVYQDDISVEGMPRQPLVNPTDWYPQIQCFSENEVHPGPDEVVTGTSITFSWPNKNNLPDGVFYKVFAYGVGDNPTGLAASGQTGETSITLPISPESAGQIGWYIILVDANGTLLDHAQCGSFSASLLTVDPPVGLKGVLFWYRP